MKQNPLTLIIGLLLLVIFGLLLFVFQVRQSEVAVVTTFGKPTRPITDAGAHFKLPWPVQRVHSFDKRVQNFEEDKLTEGLTSDGFNLLTSVYVGWQITDPTAFFDKFGASAEPIAEAERSLGRLIGNAKTGVVGRHPLSDLISATDNGTNFVKIEHQILELSAEEMRTNNYGLSIDFLGFKKIQLPEPVTQAVFERMQSERKVLADRFQFEGEAQAQRIRSDAERRASETIADAESKATQIRGKAEAEATKSLAVFQQNPALAEFIFRLNALEGSLKDRSTLIFDQHTPPFDLFLGVSTNLVK